MGYLPLFIDIATKPCVVIGGNEAAERKVRDLLSRGADVSVIGATLSPALSARVVRGEIRHVSRDYIYGDLRGAFLVFVTTADPEITRLAVREARESGIIANVSDRPELCGFITPAIVRRGELQIAISTGGTSPALARLLRQELEGRFGPEYGALTEILRRARAHIKDAQPDGDARARTLDALAASDLPELLKRRDYAAIDAELMRLLGVSMIALGIDSPESLVEPSEGDAISNPE
jgi:precorrin-2 dehydrogenase / sirohydrochlorin ferrochelatase